MRYISEELTKRLLPKELEKRFAEIGSQKHLEDPLVVARFFNPRGLGVWYATEYDPKTQMFYVFEGLVDGRKDEWSNYSLWGLQFSYGFPMERDPKWTEKRFSDCFVK